MTDTANLRQAILNQDLNNISDLLNSGADPNQTKQNIYNHPILEAAKTGNTEIVRLLLDHGADINQTNMAGYTALHVSIKMKNLNMVTYLLNNGADPNLKRPAIEFILDRYGSFSGDPITDDIILELINHGSDLNKSADKRGQTYLFKAIQQENIQKVKLLLDNGADPNHADKDGVTPLLETFEMVEDEDTLRSMIYTLLNYGANPNQADNNGYTPLLQAFYSEEPENILLPIIVMLLDYGADINYVMFNYGRADDALLIAVIEEYPTVIRVLLERGANPDKALIKAIEANDINIIRLLLDYGASPFINELICTNNECKKIIREYQWRLVLENVQKLSKQYSSSGNFQLPRPVWELILLRQRQQTFCQSLGRDKYKYVLKYFADYLEIPYDPNITKKDLCQLISKQLSYGGKYGKASLEYLRSMEGRDKLYRLAAQLGIDNSQPIQKILDEIGSMLIR